MGLGELKHASEQAPPVGLQDPALDLRQAGEVGVGQFLDQRLGLLAARGDVAGGRSQGRGALVARLGQGAARVAHQRLSGAVIRRGAVGGEEGLRFARAQGVPSDGVGETTLLSGRQAAQGQGDREDQAPGVESLLQLGGQPPRQHQPAFHPRLLAPQKLGDGARRQPVLLRQRGDYSRLVHGA